MVNVSGALVVLLALKVDALAHGSRVPDHDLGDTSVEPVADGLARCAVFGCARVDDLNLVFGHTSLDEHRL